MSAPETQSLRRALLGTTLYGSDGQGYEIRELVGEGGQGLVFRATSSAIPNVVVKVLRPDRFAPEALARFQREALVLQRLSAGPAPSPHIVRFYDHMIAELPAVHSGTLRLPFTVLEYVAGTTLEQDISAHKLHALSIERSLAILRQVVLALEAVHAEGVIHRDLKPSNILLVANAKTEIPLVKVMDFGLAKMLHGGLALTAFAAGASIGYAPPEQYESGNRRVCPASDVFSLGAVAYEIFTGHRAFSFRPGESPLAMLPRIVRGARPSLLTHLARLPRSLRDAPATVRQLDAELTRALAIDPADRHATPSQFLAALTSVLPTSTPNLRTAAWTSATLWASGADAAPRLAPSDAAKATAHRTARESAAQVDMQAHGERPRLTRVEGAVFAAHGGVALVLAPEGLLMVSERATLALQELNALPGPRYQGLVAHADHSLLLFGDRGLLSIIDANLASFRHIRGVPADLHFYAGCTLSNGSCALLATRGDTQRLVVLEREAVTEHALDEGIDFRGVTFGHGRIVAFGERGFVLTRTRGGVTQRAQLCDGSLRSAIALADGFAMVGTGGHALHVSPELRGTLERVDTLQDLTCLTQASDGTLWAGGAHGRIVVRGRERWTRANQKSSTTHALVAMWASPTRVRAIAADGTLQVGTLTATATAE